jgi:uncharacterized protein
MRIGLIADTHGLLRSSALIALRGCDQIIHAGDIGNPAILDALRALAPLTVVRGNNDRQVWAESIPEMVSIRWESIQVLVIHDLKSLHKDNLSQAPQVVVSGHSHRPSIESRVGVLHVNPGSAGPRRFNLPISVGELLIDGTQVSARLITLAD